MLDGPKASSPRRSRSPRPRTADAPSPCSKAAASTSSRSSPTFRARPTSPIAERVPEAGRWSSPGTCPTPCAPAEACDAGQRSFEHLIGVFEGSSTAEEHLLEGKKGPARFLETFDARRRRAALLGSLAKKPTWQCPTLYWERGQWLVDVDRRDEGSRTRVRAGLLAREDMARVHEGNPQGPRHRSAAGPGEVRPARARHRRPACAARAIPFLAGTDTPAGVGVLPGFSLHQELAALRRRRLHAARGAADRNARPGALPRAHGDFGTVEKGRSPTSFSSTRARSRTSATPARSPPSSRTAAFSRERTSTASSRASRPTRQAIETRDAFPVLKNVMKHIGFTPLRHRHRPLRHRLGRARHRRRLASRDRRAPDTRPPAPPPAGRPRVGSAARRARRDRRDHRAPLAASGATSPRSRSIWTASPTFHRRVYAVARTIPPGRTLTYGEIATQLGDPRRAREVGQALAPEPVSDRRALPSRARGARKSGGFSAPGGVSTKLRLLEIEGARRPAIPTLF